MGGGGGWDYDYSEAALKKSSKEYTEQAAAQGIVREYRGDESKGLPPPVGKDVTTDSPTPLVVCVDISGSMSHWPGVIFTKLPVLYNEARLHLPDLEISFAAIGDPSCHMIQICDFMKGKDLEEGINAIHPCGGDEYFELTMYYYARHCTMRKAQRGLMVICGNEPYRDTIEAGHVKSYVGDDVQGNLKTADIIKELQQRFDPYMLYVPETSGIDTWQKGFGRQMVLELKDPSRIVDCIIGLCAIFADDYAAFQKRIAIRQTPEQVNQVMATLHPLLAARQKPAPQKARGKRRK
ncbi:MAG: hypothetical protein AB1714_11965 [Acidobacteriota bacterium]